MDKNDSEKLISVLSEIRKTCDNSDCQNCILTDNDYGGCMFHARPFDWNIESLRQKLEDY